MKKCKKYSLLIYKHIDGIITVKEQKELENHIESCEKCNEEFKLITALKKELSEDTNVPLPDNFNTVLHRKLVEYNMAKPTPVPLHKRLFVNLGATLCLALGITIFAVNYNTADLKNHTNSGSETEFSENQIQVANETEQQNMDLRTADVVTYNSALDDSKTSKKSAASPTADVTNDEQQIKIKSIRPADSESVQKTTDYSDDTIETDAAVYSENIPKEATPSSGGGGSSSAPFKELEKAEAKEIYLTINISDEINILETIPFAAKDENGIFFAPIDRLDEAKELLKDYNLTIENENVETIKKDKFIIR